MLAPRLTLRRFADVLSLEPAGDTFMGAVRWSAPLLLQGGPKTEATDIFAFAMTALEVRRTSLLLDSIRRLITLSPYLPAHDRPATLRTRPAL